MKGASDQLFAGLIVGCSLFTYLLAYSLDKIFAKLEGKVWFPSGLRNKAGVVKIGSKGKFPVGGRGLEADAKGVSTTGVPGGTAVVVVDEDGHDGIRLGEMSGGSGTRSPGKGWLSARVEGEEGEARRGGSAGEDREGGGEATPGVRRTSSGSGMV